MSDKSWLLSAAAIKVAKECVKTVEIELGVRLSLAHPDFLQMLNDYAEMCESEALSRHVGALNRFALTQSAQQQRSSVVQLGATGASRVAATAVSSPAPATAAVAPAPAPAVPPAAAATAAASETVIFQGRTFARYQDGRQFKGLYRGQPKYG